MSSDEIVKSDRIVIETKLEDWYRYAPEKLDEYDDDGTMPNNVETLKTAVIGHKIVSAETGQIPRTERSYWGTSKGLILTLDDGTRVGIADTNDCCAGTYLQGFLLHPDKVQHVITGIGTEDGYTKWHIYADFGDILDLEVEWSCGNPFYYGYGFDIVVIPMPEQLAIDIVTL